MITVPQIPLTVINFMESALHQNGIKSCRKIKNHKKGDVCFLCNTSDYLK